MDSVLRKYNPGTGHDWCKKREKKIKGGMKGRTDGRVKGATCKASPLKRHMAKAGRSYKHPEYITWLEWVRKQKGN